MTAVRVVVRMADVSVVVLVEVAAGVAVALLVDVLVAAIAAGWSGALVMYRCVLA